MPGHSPEDIISIINDGLQGNIVSSSAYDNLQDRSCWRCERLVATNRWSLCAECRAYLSCETDVDPNAHKPEPIAPMPFWGWGWGVRGANP